MRFPIHIRDHERALLLDYEQFLEYHAGHALAGAAVAWRAMERAAMLLSEDQIWDRGELSVSARHAGPGVRDALEYVTRCFTRERFDAESAPDGAGPCGSCADFQFVVNDGRRVVRLRLREGVIPESFFIAVRRCRDEPDSAPARLVLSDQKAAAAAAIEACELGELFSVEVTALTPQGGVPHA